jgi:hypothetical protein
MCGLSQAVEAALVPPPPVALVVVALVALWRTPLKL